LPKKKKKIGQQVIIQSPTEGFISRKKTTFMPPKTLRTDRRLQKGEGGRENVGEVEDFRGTANMPEERKKGTGNKGRGGGGETKGEKLFGEKGKHSSRQKPQILKRRKERNTLSIHSKEFD